MKLLVRIAIRRQKEDVDKLTQSPGWQTLMTILREAGSSGRGSSTSGSGRAGGNSGASATAPWTCRHCTFLNTAGDENCEMCGLPMG